jgi:hypothetical protein
MDMEIKIFLMDFFSCLLLGKAHWLLFCPPDICNIKVVSKVHIMFIFFSSSCQSKQSPDVYFSCVTLKNLIISVALNGSLLEIWLVEKVGYILNRIRIENLILSRVYIV